MADCLPVDPFGMDVKYSTVTTIKGWFDADFGKFSTVEDEKTTVDDDDDDVDGGGGGGDGFFLGFDLFFNGGAMKLPHPHKRGNLNLSSISIQDRSFSRFGVDSWVKSNNDQNDGGFPASKTDLGNWVDCDKGKGLGGEGGEPPHDALFFALGYLGVKDLLMVERVCRSLRDSVRGDPLLWRRVRIDHPLSKRITDADLFKLTDRAQGSLQSLCLVECVGVTDDGLMQVLERNPRLTKLCVPRCVGLTVNGILFNLSVLKSAGTLRIKHLRIGELFGVTETQFEELNSLLGVDNHVQPRAKNPQFHHVEQMYHSCDDDRAIDIEKCPKCQKLRLVYDCPAETCRVGDHVNKLCRACTLCIARCINCGCCIKDRDYEETFCLDFLCLDCLLHQVCGPSSSGHAIFHHETRYHFAFTVNTEAT